MSSERSVSSLEKEKLDAEDGGSGSNQPTEERGNWSGQCDFFMSCLSYAVGLGNLWRFPYLCYENGGGAFLIPYVLMMIFAGMPLFFLELSLGQYCGTGLINIWQCAPIFTGLGYAMFMVSLCVGIYYNMVIAWSFYYLFVSFNKDVPWKTCNNPWNTEACSVPVDFKNCSTYNGTWYNQTCWTEDMGNDTFLFYRDLANKTGRRSASYEYFHNNVLAITDGIDDMGSPRWYLVLVLLLSWIIVGLCLIRGIKSSGKAVYFTALFPYVVMIILLGKAATMEGAAKGIFFYINPVWTRLFTAKIWGDAAVQIFFSLSPCWGGLITLASYNKFNNNALKDSVMVTLSNCGTSVFAGFVIFAILGFMAEELNMEVEKVAASGAGLAFVVYPEVVAQLPISPLWSILFFLMLITLGMGTQMTIVNTVHSTIVDQFASTLRKGHRPKFVLAGICLMNFLVGIALTCNGGMYLLQLMDNYCATYSTLLIGLVECLAVGWVYGWERFSDNIEMMMGARPMLWWRVMWQGVTPALIAFILIFTFVDFKPTKYDTVVLPVWADVIGWLICMLCISPIFVYAGICMYRNWTGDFVETLRKVSNPTDEWGPADPHYRPKHLRYEEQELNHNSKHNSYRHSEETPEAAATLLHQDEKQSDSHFQGQSVDNVHRPE